MTSTTVSETLLSANNIEVYFEMDHYRSQSLRDHFVTALSNPVDFFFGRKELFKVIDDVSFRIDRGMRIGILGVNGSGKTTLCRCLAGMIVPQEGEIATKADVRAIFDTGTGILPELTGRENATLLARMFFPKEKNIKDLVDEAIEFSEIGHFIDVPFKQYSRGMQARLLLSLISSKSTDLLILDEVFDGADVFFQKKIAERMTKFIQRAGATVFVSHSVVQIREVCNKVLVLDKGQVKFFGEVEEGIKTYIGLHAERTNPGNK